MMHSLILYTFCKLRTQKKALTIKADVVVSLVTGTTIL